MYLPRRSALLRVARSYRSSGSVVSRLSLDRRYLARAHATIATKEHGGWQRALQRDEESEELLSGASAKPSGSIEDASVTTSSSSAQDSYLQGQGDRDAPASPKQGVVPQFFTRTPVPRNDTTQSLFEDTGDDYALNLEHDASLPGPSLSIRAASTLVDLLQVPSDGFESATRLLHDLTESKVDVEARSAFADAAYTAARAGNIADSLAWLSICPAFASLQALGRPPDDKMDFEFSSPKLTRIIDSFIHHRAGLDDLEVAIFGLVRLGAFEMPRKEIAAVSRGLVWLSSGVCSEDQGEPRGRSFQSFTRLVETALEARTKHLAQANKAENEGEAMRIPVTMNELEQQPYALSLMSVLIDHFNKGVQNLAKGGKVLQAAKWIRSSHIFSHEQQANNLVMVKCRTLTFETWWTFLTEYWQLRKFISPRTRDFTKQLCHSVHRRVAKVNASAHNLKDSNQASLQRRRLITRMATAEHKLRTSSGITSFGTASRRDMAATSTSTRAAAQESKIKESCLAKLSLLYQSNTPIEVLKEYRRLYHDPFFGELTRGVLDSKDAALLRSASEERDDKILSDSSAYTIAIKAAVRLCCKTSLDSLARLYINWLNIASKNGPQQVREQTNTEQRSIFESEATSDHTEAMARRNGVVKLPASHRPRLSHFVIFLQALIISFIPRGRTLKMKRPKSSGYTAVDVVTRILTDIHNIHTFDSTEDATPLWTQVLEALAHCAKNDTPEWESQGMNADEDEHDHIMQLTWQVASLLGMGPQSLQMEEQGLSHAEGIEQSQSSHRKAGARRGMSKTDIGDVLSLMSFSAKPQSGQSLLSRASPLTYSLLVMSLLRTHERRRKPLVEEASQVMDWFFSDTEALAMLESAPEKYRAHIQTAETKLEDAIRAFETHD